jgi:hypothetical protein
VLATVEREKYLRAKLQSDREANNVHGAAASPPGVTPGELDGRFGERFANRHARLKIGFEGAERRPHSRGRSFSSQHSRLEGVDDLNRQKAS